MPGSTRTIHQGQAVFYTIIGGVTVVLPWTSGLGSTTVCGFMMDPDVTFSLSGPFPNVNVQEEGVLTVSGASFLVDSPVYLDANGLPTQGAGSPYFQAAIPSIGIEIGRAVSSTQVLLNIQHGIARASGSSGVLPLVASDVAPSPHGPASSEQLALKQALGIGSSSGAVPFQNGDLVVCATSNTSLTFKLQGSDGVTRTATLTLS